MSKDPNGSQSTSPGHLPGDLSEIDMAMLLLVSHRQRDNAPLSVDEERILDAWMAGRLSGVDADGAVELAKHNLLAAERVLEHRLIAAANSGPAIPKALSVRILRSAQPKTGRTGGIRNLRLPRLSGWQWSGLSAAAATIAAVVVLYGQWDQHTRMQSDQSLQIAMVGLDEGQPRRMRGNKQPTPSPDASISPIPAGVPALDLEVPVKLLRRTIDQVVINKSDTDHAELMGYLRAKDDKLDSRSKILIDTALAERVPKNNPEKPSIQIRAYDLSDPLTASIRNKITLLSHIEVHSILLTLGH